MSYFYGKKEDKKMWTLPWFIFILLEGSILATHPKLQLTVEEPPDTGSSRIYLGEKTVQVLTIDVVENSTLKNVEVEIVPTGDVANFILGIEPQVSIGQDVIATVMYEGNPIRITETTYFYFMKKIFGGQYSDPDLSIRHQTGFVLNLGNVTTIGNEFTSIEITVERFYLNYSEPTNYVSLIIVEYDLDDGHYQLHAQVDYTLMPTAKPVSEDAEFSIETVPDPVRGLPRIHILMNLPSVSTSLQVEVAVKNKNVYTHNVILSEMRMIFAGSSFVSVDASKIFTYAYSGCPLTTSLKLDCGALFNKAASENVSNSDLNLVTIEAVLQAFDMNLNGTEIPFVIRVLFDHREIWLGNLNAKVNFAQRALTKFLTFNTNVAPEYMTVSPGFPGVVEITLTIPELTNYTYTFQFLATSVEGDNNALSILGMSLNSTGNNIDCNTQSTSTITLDITETTPGSGLYNNGTVTMNIANINMETDPTEESNQVTFNLYVMMSSNTKPDDLHSLFVDINFVGWQRVDFSVGDDQVYSPIPLYVDNFENECATKTFYPDTTISYKIDVTTFRNTVVSPVTYRTALPSSNLHMLEFLSADVVFRGRNVGCVNAGKIKSNVVEWVDTDSEVGGTFLYLPLVCNDEVVNDPTEDHFVIELKLKILNLEELRASDLNNHIFITHRETFSDSITFVDRYSTRTSVDLGQSRRVDSLKIPLSMLQYIDEDNFTYKLQWSGDNVQFYNYNNKWIKGDKSLDGQTFNANRPLYARYIRLVSENTGCTVTNELAPLDFGKNIDFYGAPFSKNIMLENVMFVLDDNDRTCRPLPYKLTTETVTYYWSHYKTQILNADGASSFKVKVIGRGIDCDNKLGPQVTKVMYPKNSETKNFGGVWKKCSFLEKIDGSPMSCVYECACSDTITCGSISILLYHFGIPSEPFEICGIKIIQ